MRLVRYDHSMDALSGLLGGPRAQGAFLLRAVLEPPWSLRIEDEAPISVMVLNAGSVHVRWDDGETATLEPGDVALVRGPDHYVLADTPDRPPEVFVDPDQHCTNAAGDDLGDVMTLGVRSWGNDPEGSTTMIVGAYHLDSEVSRRMLDALPRLVHLSSGEWDGAVAALLAAEMQHEGPGQDAILDRLLDLVLMTTIRTWWTSAPGAPGWYRADTDPAIGAAVRAFHRDPAHRWTVQELARTAGLSRAAFARRFTEVVGEPPMTYLTNWRLMLAADLVCEPGETIGSVAATVGYASPYALSAAFKRVRGVSPSEHRLARTG